MKKSCILIFVLFFLFFSISEVLGDLRDIPGNNPAFDYVQPKPSFFDKTILIASYALIPLVLVGLLYFFILKTNAYWIKGGLIAVIIYIFYFFITTNHFRNISNSFGLLNLAFVPLFFIQFFYLLAIEGSISFVTGALIGFVYGKVKGKIRIIQTYPHFKIRIGELNNSKNKPKKK
ncbi:hypothetical protein HY500_02580 [Candidatus Woesearchaeota archaeon]|nr:hypothetical protein [Candidatus Woesearchaeota archaeon]